VFDNNQDKAVEFIANLIFRHYRTSPTDHPAFSDPNQLVASLFTQRPVFDEFVRAVEGVPRDALNLMAKVVTKAYGHQIAMNHVRAGARDWYNQDKAAVIRNDPMLADLLQHIIVEVIGKRRARAFLLLSKSRFMGVDKLFDSRLLHVLKKNVSSNDAPGARYDVYKIDYGCYVDLINTTRAPVGLYEQDDGTFTEVPHDDYRSIRRAILDPSKLMLQETSAI
jgi:GH24 family phage-related lysozyme (muramidase)